MPPNPVRTARTRAEILDHAARLFRLRGHAGTNIDDIMLAAGLTRGAFYAHFASKDDLFAEAVGAGHGLLAGLRGGDVEGVVTAYLDKDALAATVERCTLAALSGDVARAPLAARLAYANTLHAVLAELARGKSRRLDPDATVAAILTVGAVALARACGDRRLGDWMLRCAQRAVIPLLRPRALPKKKQSKSRRKAAGARRSRRAARSRDGRAAGGRAGRSSAARR
jgi:TetR/AcrR family transcriptional repressor of nem operon